MEKLKLDIQKFASTPQVARKSTIWFSKTLADEKIQITDVQGIPTLKEARSSFTYDALDYDSQRQTKGGRPASTKNINVLYTEEGHKKLKELSDSEDSFWIFIKLPDSTKDKETDSLVFYFQAQVDLANDTFEADDVLQEQITLYINSEVEESYGFPTE